MRRVRRERRSSSRRVSGCSEGSATVELVVLVPLVALVGVLGIAFGRIELARAEVADAARAATEQLAEAQGPPTAASAVAASVASSQLEQPCSMVGVHAAAGTLAPGAEVHVEVSCRAGLAELGLPFLPMTVTLRATAGFVLSPYRQAPP